MEFLLQPRRATATQILKTCFIVLYCFNLQPQCQGPHAVENESNAQAMLYLCR